MHLHKKRLITACYIEVVLPSLIKFAPSRQRFELPVNRTFLEQQRRSLASASSSCFHANVIEFPFQRLSLLLHEAITVKTFTTRAILPFFLWKLCCSSRREIPRLFLNPVFMSLLNIPKQNKQNFCSKHNKLKDGWALACCEWLLTCSWTSFLSLCFDYVSSENIITNYSFIAQESLSPWTELASGQSPAASLSDSQTRHYHMNFIAQVRVSLLKSHFSYKVPPKINL